MKWKPGVMQHTKEGYILRQRDRSCRIPAEEKYLVRAMENGVTEDELLTRVIMKEEHQNEIVAGLILAKYILKYQDYIEEDEAHYTII